MKRIFLMLTLVVLAVLAFQSPPVEAAAQAPSEPVMVAAVEVASEPTDAEVNWLWPAIASALAVAFCAALMMADTSGKFVQTGDTTDYTPVGAVSPGDVVVQGTLFGVATAAIAAAALGALAHVGVFALPKATTTGSALTVGKVYWDAVNSVITTTVGANVYIGKVVKAAADSDATARVRLEQ